MSSIRANRSLLDEPNPVTHVHKASANALRVDLDRAHKAHAQTYAEQEVRIGAQPVWQKLTPEKRQELLENAGARKLASPEVNTEEALLAGLQACPLGSWQAQTDALPAQFDKALAAAIVAAEPKARRITLDAATIHDLAELDAWLQKARNDVEVALQDGPVIL